MAEQSSMHAYLNWTKQRIDEMDATLASLEARCPVSSSGTQPGLHNLRTIAAQAVHVTSSRRSSWRFRPRTLSFTSKDLLRQSSMQPWLAGRTDSLTGCQQHSRYSAPTSDRGGSRLG